ncbi:substrate-binding domain-containing protein [Bifidobacterium xylocopae]|nr:substrate-binding domain-containing protein [Bifidobacterium xylocopae]
MPRTDRSKAASIKDVSVAGFNDHPIAKVWNPPLTTIEQDFDSAGQEAFALLPAKIDDLVEGCGRTPPPQDSHG